MIQNWFRSVLVLVAVTAVAHGQAQGQVQVQGRDALIQSVNSLPGWTASGKKTTFNESTIDQFDPKLAASLRNYGIDGVTVQNWNSPFGNVRATLFQFLDAGAGYGFFSIRRKIEGVNSPDFSNFSIGAESFQTRDSRYFWQASYVVRLEGESQAVTSVAKTLSENILGHSQRPPLANHLPSANLIAGSEQYILDASDVPPTEGIDSSALGFDVSAEAAAADYRVSGKTIHLLLLLYPTQQLAKKFTDQINAASPNLAPSRKRAGPLLAIVSGTTDASVIQAMMNQVHYESKVMWDEPKPGLGLGPVIVTVFTFIAILLGACIVVGISLGGFRVLMKTLYPNRVFDRPQDAEFIQLKLDQQLIGKELRK